MSAKWFFRGCMITFVIVFVGMCMLSTIGLSSVMGRLVA